MTEEEYRHLTGSNIAKFRKLSGLTQSAFAEKIGYSDKAVSKWERGESLPDVYTLSLIAEVFGTDLIGITTGVGAKKADEIRDNAKKSRGRHIFITAMSAGIVWLSISVIFFILEVVINSMLKMDTDILWVVFIYAIPITFIVCLVFACIWGRHWQQCLCVSGIVWGVAISVFISFGLFSFAQESVKYIFISAGVLQVLTLLWFGMKILFPKNRE